MEADETYDANNSCLTRGGFWSPGEVASLETEGTIFKVSTTDTDSVDTLGPELRASSLTTELKLSLLAVVGPLGTGFRALVAGWSRDT